MRLVVAVSALFAATLLAGAAQARPGDCDGACSARDRPQASNVMKERMSQATSHKESIPDRRAAVERPTVLREKPQSVVKDKALDPKAPTHSGLKVHASPSDKNVQPKTSQNRTSGKKMVDAHLASKGKGRQDKEAPPPQGEVPKALTAGLGVKIMHIVRPANAHTQVSPSSGGPQGCSSNGKCPAGDAPSSVPTVDSKQDNHAPVVVEKARQGMTEVKNKAPSQGSSQVTAVKPHHATHPSVVNTVHQDNHEPVVTERADRSRPDER